MCLFPHRRHPPLLYEGRPRNALYYIKLVCDTNRVKTSELHNQINTDENTANQPCVKLFETLNCQWSASKCLHVKHQSSPLDIKVSWGASSMGVISVWSSVEVAVLLHVITSHTPPFLRLYSPVFNIKT